MGTDAPPDPPSSSDTLFGGRVELRQPARGHGYRVNVDAILLAHFALSTRLRAHFAVDLGAGVGAVALSLSHLGRIDRMMLVEADAALAAMAEQNLAANGLAERARVLHADVSAALSFAPEAAHQADLVVTNPPYREPEQGPRAREGAAADDDPSRTGALAPFVRCMAEALAGRGRGCIVYPAAALAHLLAQVRAFGLEPKRLRPVHGRPERPARVVLLEVRPGGSGGLVVEPPLFETDAQGSVSREVESLLHRPRAEPL